MEKADDKTLIQMAIVYKGNQISIYRNGEPYASYEASNIDLLSAKDNMAVFGLRHVGATTGQHLQGTIEDARIYDRALDGGGDQGIEAEPSRRRSNPTPGGRSRQARRPTGPGVSRSIVWLAGRRSRAAAWFSTPTRPFWLPPRKRLRPPA